MLYIILGERYSSLATNCSPMKWNINDFINIVCFLTSLRKISRGTSCRNTDGQHLLSPAHTPTLHYRWGGAWMWDLPWEGWALLSSLVPVPGPSCLLSHNAAIGSNTVTSTQRALRCRGHELPRVTRPQRDTTSCCTSERQILESTRVVPGFKDLSKIPYHLYHPEGEQARCRGWGGGEARNELGEQTGSLPS